MRGEREGEKKNVALCVTANSKSGLGLQVGLYFLGIHRWWGKQNFAWGVHSLVEGLLQLFQFLPLVQRGHLFGRSMAISA